MIAIWGAILALSIYTAGATFVDWRRNRAEMRRRKRMYAGIYSPARARARTWEDVA